MDYTLIVQALGTVVVVVGGIYALRQQIKKSKEDSEVKIIEAIKKEITPIQITVEKDRDKTTTLFEQKEQSILALWKDLESLEDHLNLLEVQVAKHTGVIDIQTPLIVEIRNSIDVLRTKIESIQTGLNLKNG